MHRATPSASGAFTLRSNAPYGSVGTPSSFETAFGLLRMRATQTLEKGLNKQKFSPHPEEPA